jgi:hypothetical protein
VRGKLGNVKLRKMGKVGKVRELVVCRGKRRVYR